MTDHPLREVTEDERARWRRDGVVALRQIYPPAWVERLREAIDDVFVRSAGRAASLAKAMNGNSSSGSSADMAATARQLRAETPETDWALESDADITGRSIVETDACAWHAGMYTHDTESPLVEIVQQLTGSAQINLYSDQLFLKEAGSQVQTPWHQDQPYWLVDGGEMAVAWVPVDTVTRETSAMRYVRGSHAWGKLFKPSDFRTATGTFPEVDGISHAGLEQIDHDALQDADIVSFDAEPGDVIIHHWATLHGSTGNTCATGSRRAASIRYALDGCYFYRRASSPEPFRKTLDLRNGVPLERAARFPIVWPRA